MYVCADSSPERGNWFSHLHPVFWHGDHVQISSNFQCTDCNFLFTTLHCSIPTILLTDFDQEHHTCSGYSLCSQNSLGGIRFDKMLESFLCGSVPCCHNCIMSLFSCTRKLPISCSTASQRFILDSDLVSREATEVTMLMKPVWGEFCFVTWSIFWK